MSKYITEINYRDKENWNSIVCSFPDYDAFYLNEYACAFMNENAMNGIPILLLYENGEERGINVVLRRDIADDSRFSGKLQKEKYFDLITPYGYGGFMGKIDNYNILNQEYNIYCTENDYICEFVRFNLHNEYYKYYDGKVYNLSHNIIRSLDVSSEDIWMDFKQKVRKNIKRANKNNLKIITENNVAHLEEFLDIYYSTMNRCNAEDGYYFSKSFFEEISAMKENIMFFYVLFEEKVISTELVIYGNKNVYSYLGGTKKEYFNLRPNDFLKFEIIKWAKEKGLKKFVLGGGYGRDDGIFQYKLSFAPNGIYDFYIGKKIFDIRRYTELCNLREIDVTHTRLYDGFFPKYRGNN